jgi:hypothetical protein
MVIGNSTKKKTTAPKVEVSTAPTPQRAAKGKGKPKAPRKPRTGGDDDEPVRSNPLGLEINADVLEFIEAIDRFKKEHGRPFPSWSEVLHIVRSLGYHK